MDIRDRVEPAGEQKSAQRRKYRAVRKGQAGFAFAAMARSVWPRYRRLKPDDAYGVVGTRRVQLLGFGST
jgi:hypothetical protein